MSDNIETVPIISTESKSSKKQKQKKQKQEKLKINVPSRLLQNQGFDWIRYIYQMMKEANKELLTKPNIINAYNALVDCIAKYEDVIRIRMPYSFMKYITRIDIMDFRKPENRYGVIQNRARMDMVSVPNKSCDNSKDDEIVEEVMNTYLALYELIKRDVVPYMEQVAWEKTNKTHTKAYMRIIEKYENQRKLLMNRYKTNMEFIEKQIAFQAERLKAAQTPCIKTVFPPVEDEDAEATSLNT